MNHINQCTDAVSNYTSRLVPIRLDSEGIASRIRELKLKLTDCESPLHQKNIKGIMQYLEAMYKLANRTVDFKIVGKGILKGTPFNFIDIPEYSFNSLDYLIVERDKVMVEIRYSNLPELMAIEFMFKDKGLTVEKIECKLAHISSYVDVDVSVLRECIGWDWYNDRYTIEMVKSDYCNAGSVMSYMQSHTKRPLSKTFGKIIEYSCCEVLSRVGIDIVSTMRGADILAITRNSIYILADTYLRNSFTTHNFTVSILGRRVINEGIVKVS